MYNFWKQIGYDNKKNISITILNLEIHEKNNGHDNITFVEGDACDMKNYKDEQFDIVFSNSVIEHVGDFVRQKKMAQEIMRVGKGYFIQTPNFWFPIETHFLFLGFHWMPLWMRTKMVQRFKLGWFDREKDYKKAIEIVRSIKLLTRAKFRSLFPNAKIINENYLGMVKSFIAIKN